MRGLIWIVVAAGIVLVLVATGLVGNRDDSGETVPAGEWAQNVCGAVGVSRGELEGIVEDVRTPSELERPRLDAEAPRVPRIRFAGMVGEHVETAGHGAQGRPPLRIDLEPLAEGRYVADLHERESPQISSG